MNTKELMEIALKLADLDDMPCDTTITVHSEKVEKILMGVDMETQEIMLAKDLGYDCVVSHHPKADTTKTDFYKVMDFQIEKMVEYGVPINKAQKVLEDKKTVVSLANQVDNYDRISSAARLINMPYMNIHMPADLIGQKTVQDFLDNKFLYKSKTKLKDIVEALYEIDEYKRALTEPIIRVGNPNSFAGKIVVLFAGGTNGGADVYKAYFEAGVGTIIAMHAPKDVVDAIKSQGIGNIIISGHMASDSIGLNKIIKAWEHSGVKVTKMAGII